MTRRAGPAGVVLIVAPASDTHAVTVEHVLREGCGVEALRWDTADVARGDGLTFSVAPDGLEFGIGGRPLDIVNVRSVWWRRPNGFGLPTGTMSADTRRFCEREYSTLLLGGLAGIGAEVINRPHADATAGRKPLQLATAERIGLRVPPTLISNDPRRVRDFWQRHDRDCVYKALTPTPGTFRETRRLGPQDLADLQSLSFAPIIVQRRLTGIDLRVTVLGRRQFAAAARPALPEASTDWRLDLACRWEPYQLDPLTSRQLRELLNALGLHYGCVDLRLDDAGRPHFLEVNPSGQFLFVEVDTGQPMVEAMCALLLDPGSAWEPALA